MCDDHPADDPLAPTPPGRTLPRRHLLAAGAGLAAATVLAATSSAGRVSAAPMAPVPVAPGLDIWPRATWGAALPPRGAIAREDDVRLLLVHHSGSSNTWSAQHTMEVTYATHTRQKGWPDVCYHLFVARDGTVYEGRAGTLVRPMRADATGGSQGFSQLVCLLGDYTHEMPTPQAQRSLVRALAWLAERSSVDTRHGATCTFTSRGSQRHPAGTEVTSATIAPHRAMSFTSCPGDTFAPHVDSRLMRAVQRQRAHWRALGPSSPVRLGVEEP